MGLNDEDEDLVALRLAALSTMKAKRASENSMKLKSLPVGGASIRDGFGNKNNALFQPHFNSNLIAIVPISPSTQAEQPRSRRVAFRHQQPESKKLILPQHRYCKTEEAAPRKREKPAVKTKFNRYDSSSSDSSEESDEEGSTASGCEKRPEVDISTRAEVDIPRAEVDISATEPSFYVERETDLILEEEEEGEDFVLPPSPPPPSPPPPAPSREPPARSRSPPQPFYPSRSYADRSRSRSRSRSRPRLGRSRSPRRYGPRRSISPKRRRSSPRYSPRRRYAGSPLPSPPRRRSSPWRRYSPSPVKRNPSPPRRFSSPHRRSPLGRRVSPPRRNPSPPRRRYPPSPPSPRRYNPAGDMSPWSPSHAHRSLSPQFPRRRSPLSPRPLPRGGRQTPPPSPRPPPPKRRDSLSPSPPRFPAKRRRSISPRGPKRRSGSPGCHSPPKSRRLDERDARLAIRGLREAATITTTAAGRGNSKSLSLSPPPERVKVKSPLRLRARRHERTNGKKRTKSSKKSREKPSTAPSNAEKTENKGDESSVLEARRKKFESAGPIRPANKKIRLKTTAVTEEPPPPPPSAPERPDTPEDDGALVLDSPAGLWSEEEDETDNEANEGRFKSAGSPQQDKCGAQVVVPPLASLLEPRRSKGAEKRRQGRDKKRRRQREEASRGRGVTQATCVRDRIGGPAWGDPPADVSLPALLAKEVPMPDLTSRSSEVGETTPDPTGRAADQPGDLRAALSRKRAARSSLLFPFKVGDNGKVPGSRLVQSAFLDAVGKKQKRSRKPLTQPSFLQLANSLAGAVKDARRVTLYNKVKASVKKLSESVTLATDDSTLATGTHFSGDEMARKPPVRLRLGLPQHADDHPGGRKVKLKRNNKNAPSNQV